MIRFQNKKNILGLRMVVILFFLLGCARVRFESKEPIKVDVTMRLDIYQHVAKDVAAIEDMISSPAQEKGQSKNNSTLSWLGVSDAYAQGLEGGDYPADVQAAIERRKVRRQELLALESRGAVGEAASGFAVVKSSGGDIVEAENNDRRMIYQYVASKNQASVDETGRIFAKRIQADAPAGTPIEVADASGALTWKTK